jgi:hypothetical protein
MKILIRILKGEDSPEEIKKGNSLFLFPRNKMLPLFLKILIRMLKGEDSPEEIKKDIHCSYSPGTKCYLSF